VRVIAINSYAGSLLIAARMAGAEVLWSLEDHGYARETQRANFPGVPYRAEPPWPDEDLADVPVIAHPPCAAFSVQNTGARQAASRGVEGGHFKSTKAVVDYAVGRGSPAVMIESVPGAYEGTRGFYDGIAAASGYGVYRILQNAAAFGVPQWRPRFWCVLLRPDLAARPFVVHHRPEMRTVAEILEGIDPDGPAVKAVVHDFDRTVRSLRAAGIADDEAAALLRGEHGYGHLHRGLRAGFGVKLTTENRTATLKKYVGISFNSQIPHILDPTGSCATLIRTSIWIHNERPLPAAGYCRLMGYPDGYVFRPESERLALLSRGVVPAVAAWLLDTVRRHLEDRPPDSVEYGDFLFNMKPGDTANMLITDDEFRQTKLDMESRDSHEDTAKRERSPRAARQAAAPREPRIGARWRLAKIPAARMEYVRKLMSRDCRTHNAAVAKALSGERGGIAFDEIMARARADGWETTSPNPRGILKWHLDLLRKMGIVEEAK
jgi:site-specific DNA-cytosine methylase